ncbi:hypothetical protein M431DRAFT_452669 [Trichoderma harzianum CBS 226.95]|uniref:Uncharacterized protein n=1 Tax=Trichoderma harzianum CBS 226.95 TaxID=983964 RepID=A0A2T4AAW5_TRIHA|nr:hypothetical protein M431DRAFT_452669 [Trichoderma harzianum CBS 226.95]PTB54220.1 hypothetical protein M431DRAFT_452669 [Trichoderma harzianum CBS 226.95]
MGCRLDAQSSNHPEEKYQGSSTCLFANSAPDSLLSTGLTSQACQGSLSHLVTVMGARNAPKRLCRLARTFHITSAYRICSALSLLLISNVFFWKAKHRLRYPSIPYRLRGALPANHEAPCRYDNAVLAQMPCPTRRCWHLLFASARRFILDCDARGRSHQCDTFLFRNTAPGKLPKTKPATFRAIYLQRGCATSL